MGRGREARDARRAERRGLTTASIDRRAPRRVRARGRGHTGPRLWRSRTPSVEAVAALEAVVATAVRPTSPCVTDVDATAPRLVLGRGPLEYRAQLLTESAQTALVSRGLDVFTADGATLVPFDEEGPFSELTRSYTLTPAPSADAVTIHATGIPSFEQAVTIIDREDVDGLAVTVTPTTPGTTFVVHAALENGGIRACLEPGWVRTARVLTPEICGVSRDLEAPSNEVFFDGHGVRVARFLDGTCVVDVSFDALHEQVELEMHGAS